MLWMLDTNTVSALIKNNPHVKARVLAASAQSLCISVITQAELFFGLAKRPQATRLHQAVTLFISKVQILPYTASAATHYGSLRAGLEGGGMVLSPFDTLIAAHALAEDATLVSDDRAFSRIPTLRLENWAA
jgi:tRNA(fMet)-specific endonuclease VapC